jgi:hypothetical protein
VDERNKTLFEMMIQIKVFEIVNWIEKQELTEEQFSLINEALENKAKKYLEES